MKWKISRIEISSFKAFKHILLDAEDSSLVTLDGPNGFGKTSTFDAIELLLTGQISRIKRLFRVVMLDKKKNYTDNLYWNTRSSHLDIWIKIEFKDEENTLVLARKASVEDVEKKTNNKADIFDYFFLYELECFESNDFYTQNMRDESFIKSKFGEGFVENYSILNYLEQGQNQYLLSTKVDKRKNDLENLIKTSEINIEIGNCKSVERKLSSFINNSDRAKKKIELETRRSSLLETLGGDQDSNNYIRISTTAAIPTWDMEALPSSYRSEDYTMYESEVQELINLVPFKEAIKNRIYNIKIDTYLSSNKELIKILAKVGNDIYLKEELDKAKKEIDLLQIAKAILQKDEKEIKFSEIQQNAVLNSSNIEHLEIMIIYRNELLSSTSEKSAIANELHNLKEKIIKEHYKLHPNDHSCPLCNTDWHSQEKLLSVIKEREESIADSLSSEDKKLYELLSLIRADLDIILESINSKYEPLIINYQSELHQFLINNHEKITNIESLIDRLKELNIPYPISFVANNVEVDENFLALSNSIRLLKKIENQILPINWENTITTVFKDIEDFYKVQSDDLLKKIKYIIQKANEAKNADLKDINRDLANHIQKDKAALLAKEKVNKLKTLLIECEKSYANQTISEIELIFHIYSGRLIQNYQRGLGLFIESREGNELKFTTAEKSEHDSILSMSSGQLSAVGLAFFLALNRVYATTPIILIDDPTQSLDEINIASLIDLLRCELKDRQLIVSSHEEDISSYMRYKFSKAGLNSRTFNMQEVVKEQI
ncbi:recombinase RecF [Psychrobacter jeotgali]|uniref:recombinase RecF n=1 Tax=Psychrobacter jeotgali TaxID=179010 RepID=UPI001917CE66|nr:recombinase RecF [Psychrobacter jeotgali]